MNETRKDTWRRIRALFDIAWRDHGLDPEKIHALEILGLSNHADRALLKAAELLAKECKFAPTPAEWFGLLESRAQRKEARYRKDCWGRTILGRDGAPILASIEVVYEEPRVYALLGIKCPVLAESERRALPEKAEPSKPAELAPHASLAQLVEGLAGRMKS
jgi:hypothetical protein